MSIMKALKESVICFVVGALVALAFLVAYLHR